MLCGALADLMAILKSYLSFTNFAVFIGKFFEVVEQFLFVSAADHDIFFY